MTSVLDFIEAEKATLYRIVPEPQPPFGYGRDLSCVSDVTERLDEVDPHSVQGIREAIIRRLTCPRGRLIDDPDYGLDLRAFCNRATPRQDLLDVASATRSEVVKDDRVASCQVTVSYDGTSRLRFLILVTPADPNLGEFRFTLSVTSGDVMLEALG